MESKAVRTALPSREDEFPTLCGIAMLNSETTDWNAYHQVLKQDLTGHPGAHETLDLMLQGPHLCYLSHLRVSRAPGIQSPPSSIFPRLLDWVIMFLGVCEDEDLAVSLGSKSS